LTKNRDVADVFNGTLMKTKKFPEIRLINHVSVKLSPAVSLILSTLFQKTGSG